MTTLLHLQNNFLQALVNESCSALLATDIQENFLNANQRLQIYRHNILNTLLKSLKNIYPTILNLVGEDFFTETVKQFLSTTIPSSGDLHQFGENFADFLANFTPTQAMLYLPAVAHFEWACHQAYYAGESLPLDLNQLNQVSPENYGAIQFKLHPSHQLLDCPFPVLDIWQLCQRPDSLGASVDISTGGQKILVIRPELTVNMGVLTAGEFAFLSAFSQAKNFAEACTLALAAEPEFQIDVCLQRHILARHIVEFFINA